MRTKIMVVDDSSLILDVVGSILTGAGYDVITRSVSIGTGAAILRERPALVLMDVSMPLVTGIEISQSLRDSRSTHESVIVLHSDRPAEQLRQLVSECGADGFIRKTGDARELLTEVQRWVAYGARRHRPRTPGVLVAASPETSSLVRQALAGRVPLQTTDSGNEALRIVCSRNAPGALALGSALADLPAHLVWRRAVEHDPRWRERIVLLDEGGRGARAWPDEVRWWSLSEPLTKLADALLGGA